MDSERHVAHETREIKEQTRETQMEKSKESCNLVEIVSRCIVESPPCGFGQNGDRSVDTGHCARNIYENLHK